MRVFVALLALLAGFASQAAFADQPSLARVTAVQPPAWIESAGRKEALGAGRVLKPNDRILTGAGARVHIELAENSIVKLGENADFRIPRLALAQDSGDGIFKSAMKVLKGAFRFTTRALGKQQRREVDVTIGVATAGVRGTDIWGKADDAQDLIALLEGKIEVSSEGQPAQTMDQAGTAFVVPHGGKPLPVKPVPAKTIAELAKQTEMVPDGIAMFVGGPHAVSIDRYESREAATREAQALSTKGYATELVEQTGEKATYLLVMRGFGSKGEAARFARHLRKQLGTQKAAAMPG